MLTHINEITYNLRPPFPPQHSIYGGMSMKRTLPVVIALVLALGLLGVSSAAYYGTECTEAACYPFTSSNSYIQQKAVDVAYSNNAAVGDIISVRGAYNYYDDCSYVILRWRVKQVPTLNSSHLTPLDGICVVWDQ